MPLLFREINHGEVPFGFFNIETDMLLLGEYFFFAEDFCKELSRQVLKLGSSKVVTFSFPVFVIDRPEDVGNLMGAIEGRDLSGFIGELYRLFPFPSDMKMFKQNPEGYRRRDVVMDIIRRWGRPDVMEITLDTASDLYSLGRYSFRGVWFCELMRYLWAGGYPGWKDDVRPGYVEDLMDAIKKSKLCTFSEWL